MGVQVLISTLRAAVYDSDVLALDDAVQGTLDDHTLVVSEFLDVTDLVVSARIRRGKGDSEIDDEGAGTATIELHDQTGLLDPTYRESPLFPGVRAGTRVKILSSDGDELFVGRVDDSDNEQPEPFTGSVTLSCTDEAAVFAQDELIAETRAVEKVGERIAWILQRIEYEGPTDIETGNNWVVPTDTTTYKAEGNALTHLAQLAKSDGFGRFYVARDGTVTFRGRRADLPSLPADLVATDRLGEQQTGLWDGGAVFNFPDPAGGTLNGGNAAPTPLFWADVFDRADGALTYPWEISYGSSGSIDVVSNDAEVTAADPSGRLRATVDFGLTDLTFAIGLSAASSADADSMGLVVRYADASNYLYLRWVHAFGTWNLYKRVGGVNTFVANCGVSWPIGVATVQLDGDSLLFTSPGGQTISYTITDAALLTGTRCGLYCASTFLPPPAEWTFAQATGGVTANGGDAYTAQAGVALYDDRTITSLGKEIINQARVTARAGTPTMSDSRNELSIQENGRFTWELKDNENWLYDPGASSVEQQRIADWIVERFGDGGYGISEVELSTDQLPEQTRRAICQLDLDSVVEARRHPPYSPTAQMFRQISYVAGIEHRCGAAGYGLATTVRLAAATAAITWESP